MNYLPIQNIALYLQRLNNVTIQNNEQATNTISIHYSTLAMQGGEIDRCVA